MDGSHAKEGIPLEPESYRWKKNRLAVHSGLHFDLFFES